MMAGDCDGTAVITGVPDTAGEPDAEGMNVAVIVGELAAAAAGVGPLKPDGSAFAELRGSRCLVGWSWRGMLHICRHSSTPRMTLSGICDSRPATSTTPRPPRVAPTMSGGRPKSILFTRV